MYNYFNYNSQSCNPPIGIPSPFAVTDAQKYNQNLYTPYEGFIRGNMFPNLYEPYIAAEPFKLTPENEAEALLNQVRENVFAMIDLNLYLDVNPNDTEAIKLYNRFRQQAEQTKMTYESKYGPLTTRSEALNSYPWAWLMPPWPWEVR